MHAWPFLGKLNRICLNSHLNKDRFRLRFALKCLNACVDILGLRLLQLLNVIHSILVDTAAVFLLRLTYKLHVANLSKIGVLLALYPKFCYSEVANRAMLLFELFDIFYQLHDRRGCGILQCCEIQLVLAPHMFKGGLHLIFEVAVDLILL